jgi:cytosine permease
VPASATVSGWHIALIKIGVLIALPAFITGAEIGTQMGLPRAALSIVIGGAVLGAIGLLTGTVAALSRQSTALLVRFSFGTVGARIVSTVLALTLLGLFGLTAELFGGSLSRAIETATGVTIGKAPCIVMGGLLMTVTTIFGFRGLQRLADLAVPVLFAGIAAVCYLAVRDVEAGVLVAIPESAESYGIGISAVIGSLAVGVTILPDLARFARNAVHARWAAVGTYSLALPMVLLLAAVPGVAVGEPDLILIMSGLGLGVPAFLFLVFTAWTTNSGNLYSSTLSLASLFARPHFPLLAGAAGAIGIAMALLGIGSIIIPLLVVLGITIPPVAGIYIADFFFIRGRRYDEDDLNCLPAVAWPAFLAWLLAIVVAFLAARGLIRLSGVPAVDSIIISFIAYVAAVRALGARRRREAAESA